MSKAPLYSRSRRPGDGTPGSTRAGETPRAAAPARPAAPRPNDAAPVAAAATAAAAAADTAAGTPSPPVAAAASRRRPWLRGPVWAVAGGVATAVLLVAAPSLRPGLRVLTQDDIDAAVRASLEKEPLPSAAAKAYAAIAPSVVRVVGSSADVERGTGRRGPHGTAVEGGDDTEDPDGDRSVGTGVVVVDDGTILTNLHVVWGARKVRVTFADGTQSPAQLVGVQAENDLAVLRAERLPDDLQPATLRSTADLVPGDHVIAVGHPFGIGPSTSYGVVSGLNREFRSEKGERTLTNLIQFDAAANPGNSGGPLVTMDGQVVGIVTAILNPTEHRTFVGIGFAVPIENAAAAAGMPPF